MCEYCIRSLYIYVLKDIEDAIYKTTLASVTGEELISNKKLFATLSTYVTPIFKKT